MARKSSPAAVEPQSSPAPAAPPPAPAPAPSADIVISPDPGSPAAEPSSTPDISPDTFGWDQWDTESYDPFPEPVRPWLEKANSRYKSEYQTKMSDVDYLKKLYSDLTSDMGDPRVKEYEAKYKSADTKLREYMEKELNYTNELTKVRGEFDSYRKQIEAEEANRYRQANAWLFDGGEKQQAASALFEDGFEADIIPELMKAAPQIRESARKHHKELLEAGARNVGAKALLLAKAEFQAAAPSNPAATMISGANGTPSAGTTTPARPPTDASLRESYGEAIRLAKLQLGRK